MSLNELQNMNYDELSAKINLDDDNFEQWLVSIIDLPLAHHIQEFNWRERFGDTEMIFFNFWNIVAQAYPCNPK